MTGGIRESHGARSITTPPVVTPYTQILTVSGWIATFFEVPTTLTAPRSALSPRQSLIRPTKSKLLHTKGLEREVRELRQAKEILRKASVYFARSNPTDRVMASTGSTSLD